MGKKKKGRKNHTLPKGKNDSSQKRYQNLKATDKNRGEGYRPNPALFAGGKRGF